MGKFTEPHWYDAHRERIAAKTDEQHALQLSEAWGKHRACGVIFDHITKWMDRRERTTAEEMRVILDIRELVIFEMDVAAKELALLREMQLCRLQIKDEDWGGVV